MDYATLVLHLENQLNWLRKKGCTALNIQEMPQAELRKLLEGIYQVVPKPEAGSDKSSDKDLEQEQATPSQTRELTVEDLVNLQNELEARLPGQDVPEVVKPEAPGLPFMSSPQNAPLEPTADPLLSRRPAQHSDLETLNQEFCTCQRCPLGQTRHHFVFGEGHFRSRILFLGEGPGADEDASGRPFVGRAGKLLTKMIQALGVDRPDVYITNIVKCRPPGNRNPDPEEIAHCFPIVERQIELVNPTLIVTLGNVPTRTLVPNIPGITKVRGTVLTYRHWNVLPTFHPAYLLRNRSALDLAWQDFQQIGRLALSSASQPSQL
jgi:uracil-DNA glycosylase family 4